MGTLTREKVNCLICKDEFIRQRGGKREQVYCSPKCRNEANRLRQRGDIITAAAKALAREPAPAPMPTRKHRPTSLLGDGMTARVHTALCEAYLDNRWLSPDDIHAATGCTAPSTFISMVKALLDCNLTINKRWNPSRGKRGCYEYRMGVKP